MNWRDCYCYVTLPWLLQYIRRRVVWSSNQQRLSADRESLRLYHEADLWRSWVHSFPKHHSSRREGLWPLIPSYSIEMSYSAGTILFIHSFISSTPYTVYKQYTMWLGGLMLKERKGRVFYIAPLYSVSKRSDMDHTVLPANYTMPAFPFDLRLWSAFDCFRTGQGWNAANAPGLALDLRLSGADSIPSLTLPGYLWDMWPYFAGKLS